MVDMNKSLEEDDDDTISETAYRMSFYEKPTLDGVIFIGLCVMCAAILLMAIKLCYNYVRNFPVRKDSELLSFPVRKEQKNTTTQTVVTYSIA